MSSTFRHSRASTWPAARSPRKLKVVFVETASGQRRLELRGNGHVDGLTIRRADGTLLAAAARIAVGLDRIDVFGRDARIEAIAIDAPRVDMKRLADGTFEWAGPLLDRHASRFQMASAAARETSWNVRAGKLAVSRGTVALVDETSTFRSTLVDIAIDATNVSTRPGEKAHVKLDLVSSDRIASFSGEADVEPSAPAATGQFTLAKFSLGLLFPFYKSALAVDVQKGSIDYASAFALDAAGNLRLSEGEATITDLRLAVQGNKEPMSRVPRDRAAPDRCRCSRPEGDGRRPAEQRRRAAGRARFRWHIRDDAAREGCRNRDAGGRRAWTCLIGKLALDRVALDVEDRVPQPPFKLALRDLSLTATDVSSAPGGDVKGHAARPGRQAGAHRVQRPAHAHSASHRTASSTCRASR